MIQLRAGSLARVAAAACSLALAGQAVAAVTIGANTVNVPGTVATSFAAGQVLYLGNGVLNITNPAPVGFFDDFVFTVGAGQFLTLTESPVTASASFTVLGTTVNLGSFSGNTSNLSGLTGRFYAGSVLPGSHLGGTDPAAGLTALAAASVFGPGTYTLEVSGTITGRSTLLNPKAGAGAYAQQLLFATAVPEPASYAFMVAGLGLVGAAVRRRQRKPY